MKILCVGKNYAKHAAELDSQTPDSPIWFWKPETAIVPNGGCVQLPNVGSIHHEVEWAVRIGPDGLPDAMTVAIDVTARDLQNKAKAAGHPWTQAKGYDTFLPLGPWQPFTQGPHKLQLRVNGDVRQRGSTADMTWDLDALLAHAASWTTLKPGDILLTGTPEGVGPIHDGDSLACLLNGELVLEVSARAKD